MRFVSGTNRTPPSAGDPYAALAADYHWFFDDVALRLGSDVPGVRAALAGLPAGCRVLDAACGLGVDAAWLWRRGFDVTAADGSPEIVEVASNWLRSIDVDVAPVRCSWTELPDRWPAGRFDAVLCTGGAIAHCPDARSMVAAFDAFRAVLAPGGLVVIDTHDWEPVFAAGRRTDVDPKVIERDGVVVVRTYSWHLGERLEDPAVFEPGIVVIDGGRATSRTHPITMHPFTRGQLGERLQRAGFVSVALDRMPGDDRYTAVARRPD